MYNECNSLYIYIVISCKLYDIMYFYLIYPPVGWSNRIHQLHPCSTVTHLPIEYPGYDIKPSDGKAPVLELCKMWSIPSLSLLPGPLRPRVVVYVRILSMG